MKDAATTLILAPMGLLTTLAVVGLVEYRHSVIAGARSTAEEWTNRAPRYFEFLTDQLEESPSVRLYDELPTVAAEHPELTGTGLPIKVLEAWETWQKSQRWDDAGRLASLAIHEAPSAISGPLLEDLTKEFPESNWLDQWRESENRRAILRAHPEASGFISQPDGPALIGANRVLTAMELRSLAQRIQSEERPPPWMNFDLVVAGESLLKPNRDLLASRGDPLRVEIGIGDSNLLFARYRRVVWWVTALILCAILTAIAGIWLSRRALKRERRLGDLKSQFVASVSHELRAPVSSLRLMADALEAEQVDQETRHQFHRLMSKEGARLSTLIENVLDFACIEEGRKNYAFIETNLKGVLKDTVSLMELVATERGVTLAVVAPEAAHEHAVDPPAIQQALINLLDNAIKFSPKKSTVTVTLASDAKAWRFVIEDDGPGVPPAERERIFERFTRLGNELRREEQGTGIGLSIVRHIAEAHRAEVRVEDGPGGGARFIFERQTPSQTCDS